MSARVPISISLLLRYEMLSTFNAASIALGANHAAFRRLHRTSPIISSGAVAAIFPTHSHTACTKGDPGIKNSSQNSSTKGRFIIFITELLRATHDKF